MKLEDLSVFDDVAITKEVKIKVCCTCDFWVMAHGGVCGLENTGAGKFWYCLKWQPKEN